MTELTSRKPSQHLLGVNELKTMYSADSNFSSMGSDSSVLTKTPIIITSPVQVRATFMPKLPKKLMQRRAAFNETHLICGHYVNQDFFHSQSTNLSSKTNSIKNPILVQGDLLKARQVLSALESTTSDTIRHAKSSDTPWNRCTTPSRYAQKPSRSILNRSRIRSATFIREETPGNCDSVLSFADSNRIKSSMSNQTRLNSASLTRLQVFESAGNRANSELERNPIQVEKFAEDLLVEHYRKSVSYGDLDEPVKKIQPDIALHALGTIWEFHFYALRNSEFLLNLLEDQSNQPADSPTMLKLRESRENSKTSATQEYLNRLTHMLLEINDPVVTKHSLAVALGNLYHTDCIEVPGRLVGGALAIAYILNFPELKEAALERMSHSMNEKIIADCYKSATRYNDKKAKELCESWMEMYMVPNLSNTVYFRDVPISLVMRTFESTKMFTTNEFINLIVIAKYAFLQLNPKCDKLPTNDVIITYFSSFGKDKPFAERYPEFKQLFQTVRVYGITNTNSLNTIQHMNIYSHSAMVKIMMEIQHAMTHGGDMLINRQYESSAIRQGFVLNLGKQRYYSEVFTLYGFVFELVAEQTSEDSYKFYMQRLTTDDPVLGYEQNQLETFSMRTDRCCTYSINIQYWHRGDRVLKTTGMKKHRFGKAKSKMTKSIDVYLPQPDEDDNEIPIQQLLVSYSFIFPPD